MVVKKKTYILGMAKSPLQVAKGSYNEIADKYTKAIKPGPSRSLELDFFRLVYAAKELRAKGYEVHAYMMVTTDILVKKVEQWREKYEVEEYLVNIVSAALTEDEIKYLVEEKENNRTANTPHSMNKETNAKADYGKTLIESKLKAHIEVNHSKEEYIEDLKNMPFQIGWDYCRVVENLIMNS